MVFDPFYLVWYLSQYMSSNPETSSIGNTPGVALGRPDQPYLRPGDVVELSVTALGTQRQTIASLMGDRTG